MLVATLKTKDRIYSIYSSNLENATLEICGFYYEKDKFYSLDNGLFNELDKLKLGQNYKYLGKYNRHDIFLDLDTNLKHYYLNGIENTKMFASNFKTLSIASNNLNNLKKNKGFINSFASISILAIMGFELIVETPIFPKDYRKIIINQELLNDEIFEEEELIQILNSKPELTVDAMLEILNKNSNISKIDKKIICNRDLLAFALPYLNLNKEYASKFYNIILPNLSIDDASFDGEMAIGKKMTATNQILIDKRKMLSNNSRLLYDDIYEDTLLHEFVHFLQPTNAYCFLYEGLTEIITNEFSKLQYDPNNSYQEEQKYVKILMEIIGSEPLIKYNFTGDINYIKDELTDYLSEQKIRELLECFMVNMNVKDVTVEDIKDNYKKIEDIYEELYFNKYGKDIHENYLIDCYLNNCLLEESKYFNKNSRNNAVLIYSENPINNVCGYSLENYNLFNKRSLAYEEIHFCDKSITLEDENEVKFYFDFNELSKSFFQNNNLSYNEKTFLYNQELFEDYTNISNARKILVPFLKTVSINGTEESILEYKCCYVLNTKQNNLKDTLKELKIDDTNLEMFGNMNYEKRVININKDFCRKYAKQNHISYAHVYNEELVRQFLNNFISPSFKNSIINDACTTMFIKEYYDIDSIDKPEIIQKKERVVKILSDIIGSNILKEYYFNGNKDILYETIGNYFNSSDAAYFISLLTSDDYEDLDQVINQINEFLQIMYDTKTDNQVIKIEEYYIPKTKGYFSKKYMEKDRILHPENYNNLLNNEKILVKNIR